MLKVTSNFDPKNFRRKAMEAAKKKMDGKLASASNLRCKVHNEAPEIRSTGTMNCEISACCADFKNEVLEALKG